jgi:hypothetical protein
MQWQGQTAHRWAASVNEIASLSEFVAILGEKDGAMLPRQIEAHFVNCRSPGSTI